MKIPRLAPAALLVAGLAVTATACASDGLWYGGGYAYGDRRDDDRYSDFREMERRAFDRGRHEGMEQGRDDARHNRRPDFDDSRDYRNADEGYHRDWGPRDVYQRAFRLGFQQGYNEAYRDWRGDRRYDNDDWRWRR